MNFSANDLNKDKDVITYTIEMSKAEMERFCSQGSGVISNYVTGEIAREFIEKSKEEIVSKIDMDKLVKMIENYVKLEIAREELKIARD